jgi:hypothetical protein
MFFYLIYDTVCYRDVHINKQNTINRIKVVLNIVYVYLKPWFNKAGDGIE